MFVVCGTGRCGTAYIGQLLGSFGLKVGHESVFHLDRIHSRPDLDGDASWMAVPHLADFSGVVLHQVRHPLAVIRSLVGIRMFTDVVRHRPYTRFAFRHQDGLVGDDMVDAMTWWVEWNRKAQTHATLTYRVEDIPLGDVLDLVGVPSPEPKQVQALRSVPRDVNHRERANIGWADLPDGDRKDEIRELAVSYGYEEV